MTETQRAKLQRKFGRAQARTQRVVDKYRDYINGKKIQLAPAATGDKPIVIDECIRDTQFLTFWASNHQGHDRMPLYVKTYDSGCGYTEWREMTAAEWRKIEKMELAILKAWDAENDLYFATKAVNDVFIELELG